MFAAVCSVASQAGTRLRILLRASRFYDTVGLIRLYKSNVLSFIEYGTPAFYHAGPSVLATLDGIQSTFLDHLSVDSGDALLKLNLAPLKTRRDIAMLHGCIGHFFVQTYLEWR